ncbi:MAG: Exodeoxyribonuclease 7 large subunit [Candidatus Saccharibacteria bacterium]|nr:Exodeoxyribonuclease 7 large subunit [Candidatus Saccharibacteria bacterium]
MPFSDALTPSDFVGLLNQTLEYAFPNVIIEGELANFRISKNRWVYFDLKDENSSVKFFGTVYNLPGPLEEGMTLRVTGTPRLHNLYGFSVTVQAISLAGEGTIKKAFELLLQKLTLEGLFNAERKRALPYPPQRIGLITSGESAAYADFVKIINARFRGLHIEHADVQVQGEPAVGQIVRAIEHFNALGEPPEVLVLIRGGGSADDLQVFNTEAVTRAVAASRIPTLVAIGHEIDTSLAELAADLRASTPSNAAELLVPDRSQLLRELSAARGEMGRLLSASVQAGKKDLAVQSDILKQSVIQLINHKHEALEHASKLLELLNPRNILKRGYAVVRQGKTVIRKSSQLKPGQSLDILLSDGNIKAEVQ